jgi:hypothetical protein
MCIILTPEADPTSTRLYNLPVVLNEVKSKLLIYTNDLSSSGIMIVAIPNPFNFESFGLVDISTPSYKLFRSDVNTKCQDLVPYNASSVNFSLSSDSYSYKSRGANLIVNKVGNYDISVAPNLDALYNRIDWSYFQKPNDLDIRMSTFTNKQLFPFSCAYVVAVATNAIKDDGFGIMYPDPKFTYFPTCHENNSNNKFEYDVKCYNFSDKQLQSMPFKGPSNAQSYNETIGGVEYYSTFDSTSNATTYNLDANKLNLNQFQVKLNCKLSDGRAGQYTFLLNEMKYVNYCPIKRYTSDNQNIMF